MTIFLESSYMFLAVLAFVVFLSLIVMGSVFLVALVVKYGRQRRTGVLCIYRMLMENFTFYMAMIFVFFNEPLAIRSFFSGDYFDMALRLGVVIASLLKIIMDSRWLPQSRLATA